MKKLIALILALALVFTMVACGSKKNENEEVVEEVVEEVTEEETADEEEVVEEEIEYDYSNDLPIVTDDGQILNPDGTVMEEVVVEEENVLEEPQPEQAASASLTVLQNIWALYAEDEKFAVMGGNPEAATMDAPGVYDMAYAENLSFNLVIPADQIANIAEAATMIHMMNANTFTCGAVKLADGVDAAAFAQAVRDALQGNQWICGFPETMVIASVEDCVVIAFGVNDAMTPFQTHLAEAYAGAQILFNEAIAG